MEITLGFWSEVMRLLNKGYELYEAPFTTREAKYNQALIYREKPVNEIA